LILFAYVLQYAIGWTPQTPETAVEFDDIPASRPLMHSVDVLRHHRQPRVLLLQSGYCRMSGMGLAGEDRRPSQLMKSQHLFRVTVKGFLTGELLPAVLAPDAAAPSVSGNAALGRHSRAGEKDDVSVLHRIDCSHISCSLKSRIPRLFTARNNNNRAGENTCLAGLSYDFSSLGIKGLSAFTTFTDSSTPKTGPHASPSQNELDFTVDYRFQRLLNGLWIRLRTALITQDKSMGGQDMQDYRVIVNYKIPF
jgi:hypothetical protein